MTLPVTVQAAFAAAMVDEWTRAGVSDVVVAPGSRSTPLALAVDAAPLRVHVHLDERSAAFYALGLAISTGRPAPVIVTSGTAAVELHAAVVEAHHAGVPLVVCTADRPPELHGVGAAQTIDQRSLFGDVLRWQADLGAVEDLPASVWRSLASRAITSAMGGPRGPGPVQLNLGFREPLVGAPGGLVPDGRDGGRPWHVVERGAGEVWGQGEVWGAAGVTAGGAAAGARPGRSGRSGLAGRRGVIVAGSGCGTPAAVVAAADALGWPVLAAPASGCRGGGTGVVSAFDALLRHAPLAERLRPDVVVHLGGSPASKVLATWATGITDHVVVDPYGRWIDPDRAATSLVAALPDAWCRAVIAEATPLPGGWVQQWAQAEAATQAAIASTLAGHAEATEPGVARAVTGALGPADVLFAASSMPIRDVEWYGDPAMACRVVANRGANGIDGLVSTALGVAAGASGRTAALLGDLAFLHDSGGLLRAAGRGVDCCLVVVDNDGGGIFSFLPQAGLPGDQFERLFGTPHGIDLTALARVHGLPAVSVDDEAGAARALREGLDKGGVQVVVVRTDRAANVVVHDELVAAVVAALG